MQTPEDVQAILKLAPLGWGTKRLEQMKAVARRKARRTLKKGQPMS